MKALIPLKKMSTVYAKPVRYSLESGETRIHMNELIGRDLFLRFTGEIRCIICGRKIDKAYGQGMCYPCFRDAPENSECIIRPELCRAHLGEGRDPVWEQEHHNRAHAVYLALASAVKVGVTRETEIPTRWIDQGASQALTIAITPYRQLAGLIEIESKQHYTDRTNWQKMLKDIKPEHADLQRERDLLLPLLPEELSRYGVIESTPLHIEYPLSIAPARVKSLNIEKDRSFTGRLSGIRGQYLVFEDGTVFNVRKWSGYIVEMCS